MENIIGHEKEIAILDKMVTDNVLSNKFNIWDKGWRNKKFN